MWYVRGREKLVNAGIVAIIAMTTLFLSGCLEDAFVSTGGSGTAVVNPPTNTNNYVCDPFSTGNQALVGHGLVGNLKYLLDTQPRYTDVMDYQTYGQPVDLTLYFNEIFVPTRPFDRGFYTESGQLLADVNGNTLYEYFSIHFDSQLVAGGNFPPGQYQLGLLSDDGSILQTEDDPTTGGWRVAIDDDGTHPTTLACAPHPVTLSADTTVPIKLDYYQGPRYHISLVLLARPWPSDPSQVNNPAYCGRQGNGYWFDPTQTPSTPRPAYIDLTTTEGFAPLDPINYLLPYVTGGDNPCADQPAPTISQVLVDNVTTTSATVYWTTDIASTSQVAYTVYQTSNYTFSPTDNTLVTNHALTISGLTANTLYTVYVLSTANDKQAASPDITFRTLR